MAVEDLRARQGPMCGGGDLPGATKPLERLPSHKRHGVLFHQVIGATLWVMQDQDVGRHRVLIGSSNGRDKPLLGARTTSRCSAPGKVGGSGDGGSLRHVSRPSPLSPRRRSGVERGRIHNLIETRRATSRTASLQAIAQESLGGRLSAQSVSARPHDDQLVRSRNAGRRGVVASRGRPGCVGDLAVTSAASACPCGCLTQGELVRTPVR